MMPELLVAIPVDDDAAVDLDNGWCPECHPAEADIVALREGWVCRNCGTRYIQQERRITP